jgi:hypothetical protein
VRVQGLHLCLLCANNGLGGLGISLDFELLGVDVFDALLRFKAKLTQLQFFLNLHLGQSQLVLLVALVLEKLQNFGGA